MSEQRIERFMLVRHRMAVRAFCFVRLSVSCGTVGPTVITSASSRSTQARSRWIGRHIAALTERAEGGSHRSRP